ncbi:MAG: aldo/keto reductase [Thiogranum sp.]|jgi:diketogulonate reductase-like aldo/keto reductase
MVQGPASPKRRRFLRQIAAVTAAGWLPPASALPQTIRTRPVPASGEPVPVIGMGTWQTFDVGDDQELVKARAGVLKAFFDMGGGMVDSSPMYGSSEQVIGECRAILGDDAHLFSATKVWTLGRWFGIKQMQRSQRLWSVPRFDLMQIHNMLDWETHLDTLQAWKADGRIRYIGITTSHGRRHEALAKALERESFDFVQFTYNVLDREAEKRLLPLAAERGVAVIINRPFRRGDLFNYVAGKPIPAWAGEFDCSNWAQFFLKFIVSHPAVTVTIPATTRVDHMQENMGAGFGRLPEPAMRRRMARHMAAL